MTLTGDDEYSISDLSSLGLLEGIHQAFESSARFELGELVGDHEVAKRGLRRKLVAEADPVVEGADDEIELASRSRRFSDGDLQLVVVVAHVRDFTPRLRPRLVEGRTGAAGYPEAVAQSGPAPELESKH